MKTTHIAFIGALIAGLSMPAAADAQDLLSGSVTFESRAFLRGALWPEQRGSLASILAEPELYVAWAGGRHSLTVAPFLRLDSGDSERTHADVREAYWQWYGETLEVRAGLGRVFWGVTESQHLVDVINQTDLVENPDGEDKLGQPMLNLTWLQDWGTLDLFVLPWFRERTFPGQEGRLRAPLAVDGSRAQIERTVGLAARWFRTLGPLDLGIGHFYGTARDPRFATDLSEGQAPVLIPVYERIHQTSIDAQLTRDAWLWKLEGLRRSGQGRSYWALVGGFEYTFSNIRGTGTDLGLLAEYSHDTRGRPRDGDPAHVNQFDNDLFLGTRLALNDVQSSEVLGGAIVDVDNGSMAWLLEARRRVGDRWTLDLEARGFLNADSGDPLYGLRRDAYVQLGLGWHF